MKYAFRLPLVSLYDVGSYESWLADQSAQGLFFKTTEKNRMRWLGLVWFEKGKSERRRYRMEPARIDAVHPPVEEQELYEEMGWRFAGSLGKLFWVFEASDHADIPEPHTDPAALGELYERVSGKLKPGWQAAAWLPCILLMLFNIFWFPRNSMFTFLTGTTCYYAGLMLYILLYNWILFRHHFLPMRRLREQLARGEGIDHNAPYRRKARAYFLQNAAVLAFVLALLVSQWYGIRVYHREELFAAESLPVPLLSELEGSGFAFAETEWFRGSPYPNYVEYAWNPLTPGQLSVWQSGTVGEGCCSLQTEYYRVRFPAFAGPLFDSVLESLLRERRRYRPFEETTLRGLYENERAGFDEAVLLRQEGAETLIARRGDVVLCAEYTGGQELFAFVPRFAAALDDGR